MKIHSLCLAVVACSLPLHAQQAPTPAPAPGADGQGAQQDAGGIKIRALSFGIDIPPEEVYAHDPSQEGKIPGVKVEVKTYLNHEYNLQPTKAESLIFTSGPEFATTKDNSKVLARTKVPANVKNGIFMFLPGSGKEGETPFRVLFIDDSQRGFPPGSFKVMNLSPHAVRIQLEDKNFDFASGETKVIDKPPMGENNTAGMKATSTHNGKLQRIASTIWPNPGTKRSLQVLFLNPKSGQVEIRGIRDVAGEEF
ncbi:hypothetical protein OKA04_23830 [Luteolibacter flavescens]|uniref:Uncharacterized protein n=1 Tax=Luteolibacter flavescens TaxID=1859460 RepID=A0ABT3FWS7_9BACT|nr:hypothetical protein [Luteolibacter flavescens]MCW1887789.1 hypothetical protein [Luteolibacter flavescens]